jgi:hypothetical protein
MNQEIKTEGNDFNVIKQKGIVSLTERQQEFATHVGYEVDCGRDGIGINLGLYFPEALAEDGIISPNGINVFFPELNKIFVQNFNQVELMFPNEASRKDGYTIPLKVDIANALKALTQLEEIIDRIESKRKKIDTIGSNCNAELIQNESTTAIPIDDSILEEFDKWCADKYEFVDGFWYSITDAESQISTKELFRQFRKETIG